jgi:uncharacterized membrane protein
VKRSVIHQCLVAAVTGMRSMMPLAVLSMAPVPRGRLGTAGVAAKRASTPVRTIAVALAVAEALGDKLPRAPDRTSPAGIGARVLNGGLAAAAVAPRGERYRAAALGAVCATAAAHLSVAARRRAMRRFGRTATGLIEDALALAAALYVAHRPST